MDRAEAPRLQVEVVLGLAPRTLRQVSLELPAGSTLDDALRASGLAGEVAAAGLDCGVWGRQRPGGTVLRDGDRVECWRGLRLDPMQARRQRHEAQRAQKRKRPARAGRLD